MDNYEDKINSIICGMRDNILEHGIEAIKPGHNGPYYDDETEIRNIAHWTMSFSAYFRKTNETVYLELVGLLADYIMHTKYAGQNYVYCCRLSGQKDAMNGVIGQAWVIEALVSAAAVLKEDCYYERAVKIFKAQKFQEKIGLWNRVDLNNKCLSIDNTLNHQLWFAAAGSKIIRYKMDEEIDRNIKVFLSKLNRNFMVWQNGLIHHFTYSDKYGIGRYGILLLENLVEALKRLLGRPSLAYKEKGYHIFCLYAFAILYQTYGEHPFFRSKKLEKALDYSRSAEFIEALDHAAVLDEGTRVNTKLTVSFNIFAYGYNSPAFELPFILKSFGIQDEVLCDKLMQKQIEYTYNTEQGKFNNNTDDPDILNARIYEYIA